MQVLQQAVQARDQPSKLCATGTDSRQVPFLPVAEALSGELISIVYKLELPAVDSDNSPNV